MDSNKKYEYWHDIAQYDLETVIPIIQQYIDDVKSVMPIDKDILIEPNAFPLSEIDNDNPFVREIVQTGREIA